MCRVQCHRASLRQVHESPPPVFRNGSRYELLRVNRSGLFRHQLLCWGQLPPLQRRKQRFQMLHAGAAREMHRLMPGLRHAAILAVHRHLKASVPNSRRRGHRRSHTGGRGNQQAPIGRSSNCMGIKRLLKSITPMGLIVGLKVDNRMERVRFSNPGSGDPLEASERCSRRLRDRSGSR